MLEHTPDGPPPLVAAPRHLRRRRLHAETPDTLLVPGAEAVPLSPPEPAFPPAGPAPASDAELLSPDAHHRRKRQIALLAVIFVAIIVPALVLALLFG